MPKQAGEVASDEDALLQVCGTEDMVERVRKLWDDMMEKKRLDVADQGLTDDGITRLLKGLHMCAPPASRTHRRPTTRPPSRPPSSSRGC